MSAHLAKTAARVPTNNMASSAPVYRVSTPVFTASPVGILLLIVHEQI